MSNQRLNGLIGDLNSAASNNEHVSVVSSARSRLQYVSPTLKNDKTLVLEAVKQNGLALKYASEELKDNKTIVEMAIKQNHKAFVFCSQSLQNHRSTKNRPH